MAMTGGAKGTTGSREPQVRNFLYGRGYKHAMTKSNLEKIILQLGEECLDGKIYRERLEKENSELYKKTEDLTAIIVEHEETIDALLMMAREVNHNKKKEVIINFKIAGADYSGIGGSGSDCNFQNVPKKGGI